MPECAVCMHHALSPTLASPRRPSGTVLQPSVQAILTFGSLQPSAVTDPKGIETLVANDLNAAVGSASLAQVTEQPMTSGQSWALNVTVLLRPGHRQSGVDRRLDQPACLIHQEPMQVLARVDAFCP